MGAMTRSIIRWKVTAIISRPAADTQGFRAVTIRNHLATRQPRSWRKEEGRFGWHAIRYATNAWPTTLSTRVEV